MLARHSKRAIEKSNPLDKPGVKREADDVALEDQKRPAKAQKRDIKDPEGVVIRTDGGDTDKIAKAAGVDVDVLPIQESLEVFFREK